MFEAPEHCVYVVCEVIYRSLVNGEKLSFARSRPKRWNGWLKIWVDTIEWHGNLFAYVQCHFVRRQCFEWFNVMSDLSHTNICASGETRAVKWLTELYHLNAVMLILNEANCFFSARGALSFQMRIIDVIWAPWIPKEWQIGRIEE